MLLLHGSLAELTNEALYDRLYEHGYHANLGLSHAQQFVKMIGLDPTIDSVLDVGCSHGMGVAKLWGMNVTASGVDVSHRAVALARKARVRSHATKCGAAFCFRQAPASNLSFVGNNAFDAILSTDVLEHLQPSDAEAALDELTRVASKKLYLKVAPVKETGRPSSAMFAPSEEPLQLHSSVHPRKWWIDRLQARGFELEWATRDTTGWLGAGASFVMRRAQLRPSETG
jgi:ubiquinone/menaquinone biosynthesis C-methylase UbiE